MRLSQKISKLKKLILKSKSCVIAFSGGVDSVFLLKLAAEIMPHNDILAVTANSPTYPSEELAFARKIAKSFGVRQKVIRTNEFKNSQFIANPVNRCYFCKKELFTVLTKIAAREKLKFVFDASNISDRKDYRPGTLAKKEYNVRSPLAEAGFTKEEIRKLSKRMGLATWDKPSLACLASRIPYGTKISADVLDRINQGEIFLRKMGFVQVRLRHYNGLCRIEVPKKDIQRLLAKRKQVIDKLKKVGYNYITIDLEGYRTGSLNEVII